MWLCKDRDVFCNDIKESTHFITAFVLLDIHFDVRLVQCIYIDALMYLSLYDGFVCVAANISELIFISNVVARLFQNICF